MRYYTNYTDSKTSNIEENHGWRFVSNAGDKFIDAAPLQA